MGKFKQFLGLLKAHKLLTVLLCNIGIIIPAVTLSTVAWFSNQMQIQPTLSSSVVTSYFESGDGSSGDPYVIYRPVQYYNLVQLQESNPVIDKTTGATFADSTLFFQFGKETSEGSGIYKFRDYTDAGVEVEGQETSYLNMAYYDGSDERHTILPLGNEEHPFIGCIAGDNLTVQNLHVKGNGKTDIGVFGYVSSDALIDSLYFKDVEIDISTPAYSTSHTEETHIGHLVGHAEDAKSSFTDVYINNCRIYDSTESNILSHNEFGDIGKNDAITSNQAGTDDSYSLNPSGIYDTLEDEYDDISSESLHTRNTEYTPSSGTLFSSALSHESDGTYKVNSASSNYSLSTVGHASDDTLMNYRYLDGTTYRRLPNTTKETTQSPTGTLTEGGEWVYYDTTESKWIYYTTVANDPESHDVTFNCFAICYTYYATSTATTGTNYWMYYNNGSVAFSTTEPDLSTETSIAANADYLWVLKDSESSVGINSLSTSTASDTTVKIYSPNNKAYLTTNTSSSGTPTFVSAYSSATEYTLNGPKSALTYTYSGLPCSFYQTGSQVSGGVWNYTNEFLAGQVPGNGTTLSFTFKTTDDNWAEEEGDLKPLTLVTSADEIADGDKVSFIACYDGTYYAMGTQSGNRRLSTTVTIDSTNSITAESELSQISLFEVGTSGSYRTFKVPNTTTYLSAVSGKNYITTTTDSTSAAANWTLTISSSYSATNYPSWKYIEAVANITDDYTISFNSSIVQFSCYRKTYIVTTPATAQMLFVYLFKQADSGSVSVTSSSIQFTHEADEGSTFSVGEIYDTYACKMNTASENYELFTIARSETSTVIFDFKNSRVSVKRVNPEAWRLVTSTSTLATGDKIIITSSDSTRGISETSYGTNFRNIETVTPDSNTNTISFTSSNLAQFVLTKSGSNYYLKTESSSQYLAGSTTSNSNGRNFLTLASSNTKKNTQWSISIDSNTSVASISHNYSSSYTYKYINDNTTYFRCWNTGNVKIYKYYPEELLDKDERYISDDIGGGYDPSQIDVVGNATFTSDSVTLPARTSSSYTYGTVATGNTFYTTAYCPNSIVLYIPNTGSLDLGTLEISYTSTNSAVPQFTVNSTNITIDSLDNDETTGHNLFNINMYNIKQISLCGLDDSNQIVATNADMNTSSCDFTAITKFVVVITSSADSVSFTQLDYSFTSMIGNTGDNGTSGYMEASYDENGALQGSNNTLEGTVLNFYYDVPDGAIVDVTVNLDKTTMTYTVTFTSSVAMDVNFFNYDAENYGLVVNGITCTRGSQTISISATS